MSSSWTKLSESPLSPWLKKHLKSVNIEKPSPIQLALIKAIISDSGKRLKRNVFACSPTGTGKTLAYLLPILHFLDKDIRAYYALILAPTVELAYQIYQIIQILTGGNAKDSRSMIKTLLLVRGGETGHRVNETDRQGLWGGKPNIVVATPGKLVEELMKDSSQEKAAQGAPLRFDFLVLDEADLLVGPTYKDQLKTIFDAIDSHGQGSNRQTLIISATLDNQLEKIKLASITSQDEKSKPVIIDLLPKIEEVKLKIAHNPNLDQRYVECPKHMKPVYLIQALSQINFKQVIIFCSSVRESTLLHKLMINLGFDESDIKCHPVLLVGTQRTEQRLKTLEIFRSLKSRILIATGGLAGRGLDLPQVDLVVLYNVPENPVEYIHRVGRTCRKIDFSRIEQVEQTKANISLKQKIEDKLKETDGVSDPRSTNKTTAVADSRHTKRLKRGDNEKTVSSDEKADISISESEVRKSDQTINKKKEVLGQMSKAATQYYGKSLLFITQHDIESLQSIEKFINLRLEKEDLNEEEIVTIVKPVELALAESRLQLIDEQQAAHEKRK